MEYYRDKIKGDIENAKTTRQINQNRLDMHAAEVTRANEAIERMTAELAELEAYIAQRK
jgi:hypothetical protein